MAREHKELVDDIIKKFSRGGVRLFKNENGMAELFGGRKIKYGLCSGSHDIIGWKKIKITEKMVGKTIAQFVGVEAKVGNDTVRKNQKDFHRWLSDSGGLSIVARSVDDVDL